MNTFASQICIKVPGKQLCSASPIVECGQAQESTPADPYSELEDRNGNPDIPDVFVTEVTKIVNSRQGILKGKGDGTLRAIKLLLHHQVSTEEPFVVMGLG